MRSLPNFLRATANRAPSMFQRMTNTLRPASIVRKRRVLAITATFVLALSLFGGYAAIASSSAKYFSWQQLVNHAARTILPPSLVPFATTYTWNQAGTASWATAANWTPTRTTPATDDILIFNNGATTTVTNVPTQTIGQLSVSGNTTVNLQANAAATVLTIGGGSNALSVASGSALNINGANTTTMTVAAGSTGSITGNMTFGTAAQALTAADATGITFNNGSKFTQDTGCTGNVFGSGTSNSIVFASGSEFIQKAGSNPFQKTQPASVVVFNTGSTFRLQFSTTPSFSGRTYANFEYNPGAGTNSPTGASALSIDNLTVTSGTINIGMTGTFNLKGNVSVASGAALNFNAASASTISVNGSSAQTISNLGTLTFGANESVTIANTNGVTINNSVTLQATTTVNSSATLATAATLTNSGTMTVNGTFQVNQGGSAVTNPFTYGASSTLSYNGTSAQTSTNIEFPSSNGPANLTVNNAGGVTMHAARAIGGTLTLTSGKLTTTSANLLTVSNTAANAVSAGSATAYVNGPLARLLPASLVSGSTYSFPVGKAGFNPFELVNPTTNAGGTVTVQAEEFDGSSGGAAGTGLGALNSNRYWQSSFTTGGANFTNTAVRLTDATVSATNRIGQSVTQTGSYNSIGGTASNPTITSNTISSLNFFNIGTVALPTIVAGGPLTRKQGTAASNSTIATVSDASAGTLTVTATTVPTGITVNTIINSSGTVTANVAALCNATVGANTVVLTVTNGTTGLTNTANLTVNVQANDSPTVGNYTNQSVLSGTNITVTPSAAPADNGSIASVTATASPNTFTGSFSGNTTIGALTITNAAPAGTYTITVTVTDNCGATVQMTFMLTVNACPSLFTVDDTLDTPDANPGDGVCDDGSSDHLCTLRAAIMEANAITACSPLTIDFSVTGTINLTSILPAIDHPNLTISGPGADQLDVHRNNSFQFRILTINSGKTVAISGLTISNGNSTPQDGGGIFNQGTLSLTDCVLSNNTNASGKGGGVASTGPLTVTRCAFTGNSANIGGGIAQTGSTLNVTDSTFSTNTAITGGGVSMNGGTHTLTNCTISGNTATSNGGGVGMFGNALQPGTATLTNCTISGNTSTSGAGVFTSSSDATVIATQLKNTLVAGNNGNNFDTTFLGGATNTSLGNNLDSDGTSHFTNGVNGDIVGAIGTPINALLASLSNYGGTTHTHALLPGSPAINAGTSSGAPTTDQRGSSRFGATDIGAFESQGFTLAVVSGSGQSTVVNTAFGSPLSLTVAANNAGEPVNGGRVTFTPPGSGASASVAGNPVTIASGMATTGTVTANAVTGSYNVLASANGASSSVNFALTNTCQTITVNNPATNTGTANSAFTATFTQTGGIGTTNFSTVSTLPTGITLSTGGVLSGTPTQTGSFPITVKATDSNNCMGTSVGYTLTINCQTITVTNPATTTGTQFSAFTQTFTQTGGIGTTNFSTASTLPTGLTLSSAGVLSGTPTQTGTFPIVVKATDSNNCMGTGATYTLVISAVSCVTSLTVNNTGDGSDATPGNGVCETATGNGICTLRAAIQEANALPACTPFTINFSVTGTITLANGQLLVTHPNLTINGPGASQLTVSGNNASRIFEINSAATASISGLTVTSGNGIGATDSGSGGGIYSKGKLTLTGCVVTGNTTTGVTIHEGGGIFNAGTQLLSLTNCTISNNIANFGGAGVISFGNLVMTGCTVTNNTNTYTSDSGRGGGIETYATTTITNSTISNNHIDNGTGDNAGGIWNCCGPLTIINSTITGNSAAGNSGAPSAGGLLQDSCCGGSVTVLNSIIAGNTGTSGAVADVSGTFISNGYNLIGDGTGSTGFTGTGDQVGTTATPINALLSSLGNFGGSTQTHALLPGSPAINAGTSTGAPITDQRGSSRFGATDIGAFESQGFTLTASSGNNQSATVNTVFGLPLKVTVTASGSEPVNGGKVTFTPPGSSASASVTGSPVTIASGMATTGTVTANSVTGNYNVAASTNGASSINFALTNTCQTITVNNPATTTGTQFSAFSQTFTQTGGIGTTNFSTASTLPTGLTLSTAGVLSGTPTQTGTFPIVVKATDSNGCMGTGATYNLVINTVGCVTSLTVNNLGDGADATPGNGVCETATGNGICTLRAAIEEANAIPACSPLTINFSVTGTINLATELPWLEHPNLTIQGPGANLLSVSRNVAAAFTIFIVTGDVVTINDLTVSNGDASGTFDIGGGIYNGGGMLTINRCQIASNTATQGGGVMNEGGDVFINNSTIRNNSASSEGAGVYNLAGEGNASVTLTNCTISGNTVTGSGGPTTAGGLVNFGEAGGNATASLINCTLTNNETTSSADAGGIFSATDGDPDSRATITLKNTLLAGNASPQAMKAAGGAITSQGNNLDSDGSTGFTNGVGGNIVGTVGTPINPLLAPLSNYGGTTLTHALLPGSPAINAGTSSGAPITDQRGSARVGQTDMGAFESQGFTLTVASGNGQSAVVNTAFALPLKVTVTASGSEPVNGGKVTFTPPVSGAGATVAGSPVTIASGMATTGTVTANSVTGSYNVAASANGAAAGVNFALTNTCQTITVTNPGTNSGTANAAFSATFTQTGGIGTTTFSTASTLPTGITLAGNGLLSGTPTQTGSFPITVKATDSNNCMGTSVGYTLTINCQTITVTAPGVNTGTTGTPFSQTFTQTGGIGTTNFSTASALPTGITLSTGGVLSGTPTQSGVFPLTVKATDSNGCMGTSVGYTLTINQAPAFTSANTTTFTINTPGSFPITTSGFPTVTTITRSGTLPTGVNFTDNGNGTATLSGTPAIGTNGNYPLTFTASNGIAPNATQNFTLVVSGLVCPSTLTVNNLGDADDANPGDGICATGGGVCTLRAAVQEANAIPACTPLTINFSVTGTINLGSVLPDLNHPNLTITGPGAANLTVARNSATPFRIFAVSASRTVTITGLKITNGLAPGTNNGGGISNSGTLTLSQCVISGNTIETTSVGGSGFGGGIYSAGPLTIDRCEISGNSGRSGAGITHNGLGSGFPLIITNSTISGNTGVQSGGFDIRNTSASLTNCTISGNTAPGRIGGIDQVAQSGNTSSLSLTNCTVTNNTGSAAIETFGFAGVTSLTTTLKNTLVAGNVGANFTTTLGTLTSLGNNLDSDGTSGFSNGVNGNIVGTGGSPINALLGPLTQNGGPTQTHALLPGSPAIDKGGAGVATDQRGQARPFDIPGVTNAAGGNASDIGAFEVQCAAISLAGLPSGLAGVPYASGNIASGGTAPYNLSVSAGSLPPGVTISGNGLTGTPTQLGTFNFTLLATDAYGCQNSQSYTVVITCPTITLSPATLPNATINTAYPQTITASPAGSYSFAVTSGVLPAGLTLNSNGSFSGAPTQGGNFNFRVTATSFGSCSGFRDYILQVNCTTITLAPSSLPGGTIGTAYNQTVSAAPAGSYTFAVSSGSLPAGLTINSATGAITGQPTTAGTFNFTIRASAGSCFGSQSYTVVIGCQTISFSPTSLPAGTAGTAYSQTLTVTPAGNYTFSLAQGNLPSGLTLNPTTGVISGLPAVTGTVSFIVKVQIPNSCSTTQPYTLTINCPPAVTLAPASLPNGTIGTPYNQTLSAAPAGGNYAYTVTNGSLPVGLSLNAGTGVISGTPSVNGMYNFSITATGFGSCASAPKAYTIVIGGGGCPTITLPASLPNGAVGQLYSNSVAASPADSYNYSVSAGVLPPGLTLFGSFGLIFGYPTAQGTYNFTITATLGACTASQQYTVVVGSGVVPPVLQEATVGKRYTQHFNPLGLASGVNFSVASGKLPTGITLTAAGALSGTPSEKGSFLFTLRAADAVNTALNQVVLKVNDVATPVVSGSIIDPLNCTRSGSAVNVSATVSNNTGATQTATFTATLPVQLLALPGSCSTNVAGFNCSVTNASTVTATGTLTNNQSVTITYQAQIADGVPAGAQVCVTSTASFAGAGSASVQACTTLNCPTIGVGSQYPAASLMSDQKAGSVLIYNIYTSATDPTRQNTRLSITNTDPARSISVHLFFIDGSSCSVADSYLCLTQNQTASFLASDLDPGTSGYVVAVATDANGCPTNFNFLIGDEYVKFSSGHAANLSAEAIAALPGGLAACNTNSTTAAINFDGISYNQVPRVLAVDNIGSRADGNDTLLILNRIGGNLATGASTLGTVFGILYDDSESGLSFSVTGSCQLRNSLSNTFPRTTPRFENFILAGRSGWLKVFSQSDIGLSGSVINFNPNAGTTAGAFNQGHNLHTLTNTSAMSYTIPVFPPGC